MNSGQKYKTNDQIKPSALVKRQSHRDREGQTRRIRNENKVLPQSDEDELTTDKHEG